MRLRHLQGVILASYNWKPVAVHVENYIVKLLGLILYMQI
jgi:hypothetical protein